MQHIFLIHTIWRGWNGMQETFVWILRTECFCSDGDNWKKVKNISAKLWSAWPGKIQIRITVKHIMTWDLHFSIREDMRKPMMRSLKQHGQMSSRKCHSISWQPLHPWKKTIFLRWNLWKKDWSKTVITLRQEGWRHQFFENWDAQNRQKNGSQKILK